MAAYPFLSTANAMGELWSPTSLSCFFNAELVLSLARGDLKMISQIALLVAVAIGLSTFGAAQQDAVLVGAGDVNFGSHFRRIRFED